MGLAIRRFVARTSAVVIVVLSGCSRPVPPPIPVAPDPPDLAASVTFNDLASSLVRKSELQTQLDSRVTNFSVSLQGTTARFDGTINGDPQNRYEMSWQFNDPRMTRAEFDAMIPKLFDELDLALPEFAKARGAKISKPGDRTKTSDGLPEYEIQYRSGAKIGWVRFRQAKSTDLVLDIRIVEEPL